MSEVDSISNSSAKCSSLKSRHLSSNRGDSSINRPSSTLLRIGGEVPAGLAVSSLLDVSYSSYTCSNLVLISVWRPPPARIFGVLAPTVSPSSSSSSSSRMTSLAGGYLALRMLTLAFALVDIRTLAPGHLSTTKCYFQVLSSVSSTSRSRWHRGHRNICGSYGAHSSLVMCYS